MHLPFLDGVSSSVVNARFGEGEVGRAHLQLGEVRLKQAVRHSDRSVIEFS